MTTLINPAKAIEAFAKMKYNAPLFTDPGHINIVYVEGMNPNWTLNTDRPNQWNDLRLLIQFNKAGQPQVIFSQIATTEPGREATMSKEATRLGGVARITFGFHKEKWIHGYHNYAKTRTRHPALVQRQGEPVMVHRDLNKDFIRTGDRIAPAYGINHHGVLSGTPATVGRHSAGCPVGLDWQEHLLFLDLTRTDIRFIENPKFPYSSWFLPGDELMRFRFDVA